MVSLSFIDVMIHHILVEWVDGSNDEVLCLYKLSTCAAGIEVSFCFTIKNDFSWQLSYRGQLIESSRCPLLHDFPKIANTGIVNH